MGQRLAVFRQQEIMAGGVRATGKGDNQIVITRSLASFGGTREIETCGETL
jgi:hypothetical protein